MTDRATRIAERLAHLEDNAASWARLAWSYARAGDAPRAYATACSALDRDAGASVRELLTPPPDPNTMGVGRPRPPRPMAHVSRGPRHARRLLGPQLVGDRLVDIGRGLVAYQAPEGLVGADVFGRGVAWTQPSRNLIPWAAVAGALVAVEGGDRGTLRFLDPSSGGEIGRPIDTTTLGLDSGQHPVDCLSLSDRRMAIASSAGPGPSGLDLAVLDLVDRRVVGRQLSDPYVAATVAAVDGLLVFNRPREATLDHEIVATHGDAVAWTSQGTLLGVVDGAIVAARPSVTDETNLVLLRPTDGAVLLTAPAPPTLLSSPDPRPLLHAYAVNDVIVVEDSHGRLLGLDRRTWAESWAWSPGTERWAFLLPFSDLAVALIEREDDGATQRSRCARRATAVVALDPSSGVERWRMNLERELDMAGDPALIAGRILLPDSHGAICWL